MRDFLNNLIIGLGGRKFLLAVASLLVGGYIEAQTARGVTPAFAGLVTAILAAFSMSNTMATKAFMESKKDQPAPVDINPLHERIDQLSANMAASAQAVQNTQMLLENVIKLAQGVKK
jgi:hypothetical protein